MGTLNRRDFFKAIGLTSASTLAACGIDDNRYLTPIEQVLPYVVRPDQVTPGTPTFFATSVGSGPDAWPVLARHRDGRVINVGANPKLGSGGVPKGNLFELQQHFSPDRIRKPLDGTTEIEWDAAIAKLAGLVKGKGVGYLGGYKSGAIVSLLNDFTGGNAVFWEPLGYEAEAKAAQILFGESTLPAYDLSKAHYVLSFGADFLGTWGGQRIATDYADARNPNAGHFIARLAWVGAHLDQSGSNADDFFAAAPGSEALVALAVAKLVATKKGYNGPLSSVISAGDPAKAAAASGLSAEQITAIAEQFAGASAAVALPGGVAGASTAAVDLAVATYALNIVSGNGGKTFGKGGYGGPIHGYDAVQKLIADINSGAISVLLVDDANPLFSLPAASGIAEALAKVTLVSVYSHPTETNATAALTLPCADPLEDWGDAEPGHGISLLRQPGQTALWGSRSLGDVLLAVARDAGITPLVAPAPQAAEPDADAEAGDEAGDEAPAEEPTEEPEGEGEGDEHAAPAVKVAALGFEPATWREYIAARWQALYYDAASGTAFQRFWEQSLQRGGIDRGQHLEAPSVTGTHQVGDAGAIAGDGAYFLVAYPHAHLFDGRWANQPWAQETPDPCTGNTWDSFAVLHPDAAAKLGVQTGSLIEVATPNGKIEVGAQVYDDIHPDVIAIAFGQGHSNLGRYANGTGKNVVALLGAVVSPHGTLAWQQAKAAVKATGAMADLATTFGHADDYLRQLAPVANAQQLAAEGDVDSHHEQHAGYLTGVHHLGRDGRLSEAGPEFLDFYGLPDHPVYRWGMSVDVNACNGCGTCAVACSAENNIAIVGKTTIKKQREMSWIRINRYSGDRNSDNMDAKPREARFMPVMCQQCGHAPCESVCPVIATYHTIDGLNAMVYNRCAGTRYCANACPYKARRFNWHSFEWPEPFNLQLNPDVTVRTMGVMEKCTFCVQRVKATVSAHRDKSFTTPVPSSAVETLPACAEACPSGALTFGNINEKGGKVHMLRNSNRSYQMLAELNVFPAVNYLARASFHAPERHAHAGAHAGGGQGDASHSAAEHGSESHDSKPHGDDHGKPTHGEPTGHEETH